MKHCCDLDGRERSFILGKYVLDYFLVNIAITNCCCLLLLLLFFGQASRMIVLGRRDRNAQGDTVKSLTDVQGLVTGCRTTVGLGPLITGGSRFPCLSSRIQYGPNDMTLARGQWCMS